MSSAPGRGTPPHPHRELLRLLRGPRLGHGRHGQGRRHRRPHRRLPRRGHDADPRQGAREGQHHGLRGHVPGAPRPCARRSGGERDQAGRQRRRAQPRRAGRRDPRAGRPPRARPAGLLRGRRRRLRPPRRAAARRPCPAAPDQRRAVVVLAAPAADGQRVPGRFRHRPRPRARRRHRRHRPRHGRLPGRRSGRLVVGLDPVRLRRPGRRGRRRACHRMRAPGDRWQLLRVPEHPRPRAAGVPDRRDRRGRLRGDHQEPGHRRRGHPGHGHRPTALRDRRPRLPQPRRDHPPGHRHAHRPRRRPRADQRRARHSAIPRRPRSPSPVSAAGRTACCSRSPAPTSTRRPRSSSTPSAPTPNRSTGSARSPSTGSARLGTTRTASTVGTQLLRIAVQGTREAAGRAFSSRMVELALSGYPGLYSLGPPQPGSAFGVLLARPARAADARAHGPPP